MTDDIHKKSCEGRKESAKDIWHCQQNTKVEAEKTVKPTAKWLRGPIAAAMTPTSYSATKVVGAVVTPNAEN